MGCIIRTFLKNKTNKIPKNKTWSDSSGLIMLNVFFHENFQPYCSSVRFLRLNLYSRVLHAGVPSYQLPYTLTGMHYPDSALVICNGCICFTGLEAECPVGLFHSMMFSNPWRHLWLSQWAGCGTNYKSYYY